MKRVALLMLAAVASPTWAQRFTPAESARVDKLVADALAQTGVPSASIAVVRGGEIAFAKAYGKQSEAQAAPSIAAKYQIASVSKQFTAAALLMLQREGKLSLDDHVAKYVPGVSGGDRITLRQLLSHTSGLQDYWPQDYSFAAMEKPVTPPEIVQRWGSKPLDFAPGTQWQYSNTGYVVAGLVIEKAAGQPMMDYLQARIFRPLGIDAISLEDAVGPGFPQGYHRAALGPVRVAKPAARGWLWSAGELAMSPTDLAKWDIARIDRRVMPAADWAEQERPVRLADGASSHYGLGVGLGETRAHPHVEHGGEAVGFLTDNTVFPEDRAAIVVAVNADFGDAQGRISDGIAEILFPPRADANTGTDEAARTALARRVLDQLAAGTLDRALLTEDARYYFTPQTTQDYRSSLSALGAPTAFAATRSPRLRGGFVNRNYRITYGTRVLNLITYSEPGQDGKFEQFLVMPAS